ncbi:flagellar filament capping protein FliD [Zhenpiania hominis]|uniref:Flagellar hook-associated protein 2 n=1 Tax=Zhenpiania hominis TaxID=2763644 RepID=A0A923NKL3_9FIRM|nr:flagellar filament capping protein FliD [Zhenpiania hominis]MBC6678335.1 flagellar filament capping protein FliD [Zhenpiania hominis]
MASIGGLTSATSTSSIRGYGGLASGLDRDTLIEQLTYGTRSKIAKQQQNKQSLQWEQEAIRAITDKIYDFTDKYTSYASPSTNLTGSGLFSRNQITAQGTNSKYISVSGTSSSADMLSVVGIKQLAEDAKIMGSAASTGELTTNAISNDLVTGTYKENLLEGQYLYIKYGNDRYSVKLGSGDGYDYDNLADVLNKSFAEIELNNSTDGKKLSDVLEASTDSDGKLVLTSKDTAGNNVEITGGTGDVLKNLGFLGEGETIESVFGEDGFVLSTGKSQTAAHEASAFESTALTDYLAGKTLTFNYNGVSKTIEIGSGLTTMEALQEDLQKKLDDAFGTGRVNVGLNQTGDSSELVFTTTIPGGGEDRSSMLTITGGSVGLLGKENGLLGINAGATTRINTSDTLAEVWASKNNGASLSGTEELVINGVKIEIAADDTIEDIMEKINSNEAAKVTISYQKNSDRFMITSTEKGASGSIKLEGEIADMLFGADAVGKEVTGQDAIVAVKYAGDPDVTEIRRDSNSFTVDGLNLSLKGTFGYTEAGVVDTTAEAITFDAQVDVENTTNVVKEMIEAFNDILKLVSDEVNQKPDRDYQPLTDEQKEEMSDDQIERWEEKAKEGLLFNDTDVRGLADALRFMIPTNMQSAFAEIGISVSTDYADNGKLVFDETKFKAALESDPEKVKELFTRKASEDENGNRIQAGLMENMSSVMKTYAGTTGATKGILVVRAGSVHAPTSVLQNSLQKQMDEIDDLIESLQDQLQTEQDRYISQFTTLETLIAQMNSQSSYLAQLSGGY